MTGTKGLGVPNTFLVSGSEMPRTSRCPPKRLEAQALKLKFKHQDIKRPSSMFDCQKPLSIVVYIDSSLSNGDTKNGSSALISTITPPINQNESSAKHRSSLMRSGECEVLELAATMRSARDNRLHGAYNWPRSAAGVIQASADSDSERWVAQPIPLIWRAAIKTLHLSLLSHPQLREIPLHLTPIEYGGRNRCSR
jgi:hypothetical protein